MMKKSFIIISILMLLGVVGSVGYYYKMNSAKTELTSQTNATEYLALAKIISKKWTKGGKTEEISRCEQFKSIPKSVQEEFSRCNPEFLSCYLLNNPISHNGKSFKKLESSDAYFITLESNKISYKFKLHDFCHMSYLPQSLNSAGVKEDKSKLWDNFHENVYIDKYYVSTADIRRWRQDSSLPYSSKAYMAESEKEMRAYCASKGKLLLESRYLDAASFKVEKDIESNYYYKSNYHHKRGRSFLNVNRKIKARDCRNIYVKECEGLFPFHNFDTVSQSWIGINYVLGGHEEYVLNRFNEKANTKVSSHKKLKNYLGHRIGTRINFKDKGAFRCMLRI